MYPPRQCDNYSSNLQFFPLPNNPYKDNPVQIFRQPTCLNLKENLLPVREIGPKLSTTQLQKQVEPFIARSMLWLDIVLNPEIRILRRVRRPRQHIPHLIKLPPLLPPHTPRPEKLPAQPPATLPAQPPTPAIAQAAAPANLHLPQPEYRLTHSQVNRRVPQL